MNPANKQVKPPSNTPAVGYKSPYYRNSLLTSIFITEQGGAASTFSVAVVPPFQAEESRHYIFVDTPICANQTIQVDPFLTITANTEVKVKSSTGSVSFTIATIPFP